MRPGHTLSCPLCGLRYANRAELDLHARDDHAPLPAPERQETIVAGPSHRYRQHPAGTGPAGGDTTGR